MVKASPMRELVTSCNLELEINSNKLTSWEIQLRAIEIAGSLASLEPPNNMTGWYCLAYKKLGEGRYMAVANMAKQGHHPKRLFNWLLKQELNKCRARS